MRKNLRNLWIAGVVLLFPSSVNAVPISQYHQNVQNAIGALEKLLESSDEEETSEYEKRYQDTLESIRADFPLNQTVEVGEDVTNVDNSWLHKALDELKKNEDDRYDQHEHLIDTLKAIDARVAERQEAGPPAERKEWAKGRLESILSRPEYASAARGPNALTRLIRDFLQWLAKFLPKRGPAREAPSWLNLVAKIVVLGFAALVVFFLVKILLSRFKRSGKIKTRKKPEARIVLGERLEPEQTATDLLSEAEALARRGELRAAIRKAYIALLVELGDRKIISLAQHKTNRDYLNAVRGAPQLHSRMRGLTDSFERHWYGFVNASENDWQDFRDGYLAALRSGTN